jgi:hypothetical protein
MTTCFQTALRATIHGLQRTAGIEVQITRGDQTTVAIAVRGRSAYQVDDGQSLRLEYTDNDMLFVPADYAFGSVAATPLPGDRIREVLMDGLLGEEYEVMGLGGEQCYRLDQNQAILRVHTKRV